MSIPEAAERLQNLSGNVLREMLKITERPEMISFAGAAYKEEQQNVCVFSIC